MMKPSDTTLDIIAEMAAKEPVDERALLLGRLETLIYVLCQESGIAEVEMRAELETRIHIFEANKKKMTYILNGLR